MAITVTHKFVSVIPDGPDDTVVRPSNWNDTHELTGLGTMAEQNANNVSITGGAISGTTVSGYIPTTQKGVANGVASLDSNGQVPLSQLPPLGELNYQGTWNATTNSPTLTSSVGTKGFYYVVSVAGTTNLNGITDWQIGDWAVYNGSVWQKVDNTDAVTSVNGQTGAVVLTTTNVAEGANQYFTTARARASVSAGTGISYDNTTGVITNSSPSLGGDVVGPASATDNAIARFDTTTGKLIQNSVVTIDDAGNEAGINSITFDTTPTTVPTTPGSLYWDSADGNQTLSLVMANGDAVQQIGEEQYFRIKASAAITEGQVVMFTGSVGASGGLTGAPASGLTASTASYVMGIATQDIALNGWGYVTSFGLVREIDTSTFTEGSILYYDPTVAGGLTATIPAAPNAKVQVCAVVHSSATVGSLFVRPAFGGILGQYEGDVQVTSPANGQLLIRDQSAGKWVNATLTDGTGISVTEGAGTVTVTNTAPDQTVSITGAGTTVVTGTYPNFTVTSNDEFDGTVTSVGGTGTVNGITLTGTVTSSGNLTLGGTLGGIANSQLTNSSITINGTPVSLGGSTTISATPAGSTTQVQYNNAGAFGADSSFTYGSSTLTAPNIVASNGLVMNNGTVGASFSIASGYNAMSVGPVSVASGQSVTVPSGSRWVVL